MLDRADSAIERQLDLAKFLQKQRLSLLFALTSLPQPHFLLLQRLGKFTIHDSSSLGEEDTYSDDESTAVRNTPFAGKACLQN